MIYLDTSAALRLVISTDLYAADMLAFTTRHQDARLVSSALVVVETRRGLARLGARPALASRGEELLRQIVRLALDDQVLEDASRLPGDGLRSLDAIHVATALRIGPNLTAFATYDRRQAAAAQDAELPVVSPGMA